MGSTTNNESLKFISFNCKSFKRSSECIRRLSLTADIIALQETWMLPHEIPELGKISNDFGFSGKSAVDITSGILRGRPYGGVALLWRNSKCCDVSVIPCESDRVCAIKMCVSERLILVFSVYMPTDSSDNLLEFVQCLSEITSIIESNNIENVFIMGDFNAHPGELFGNELHNFCNEQNWTCVDLEMLGLNSNTHTFVSEAHGSCRWLDHCIVTDAALSTVSSVRVCYDIFWSDHYPVEVQCNLKYVCRIIKPPLIKTNKVVWGQRDLSQIEKYTKYCNNRLREIGFPSEFHQCGDGMCSNSGKDHLSAIDTLYGDIVTALQEAAVDSYEGSVRRHRARQIVGWNKYVSDSHREARQKFLTWVSFGRPRSGNIYKEMYETRKTFKNKLHFCQNNQDLIKMNVLATKHKHKDFKGFWKQTKQLNPKPSVPVSINGASEPRDIANLFRCHFQVESPLKGEQIKDAGVVVSEVPERVTAKQVALIIKGMTRGKSPGHDGLSVEHFQHAGPHLPRVLGLLFTLCIRHSYLPDSLMRTVVVPIIKNKTGDNSDKCNYRPISLATTTAKILDGLLERQLNEHLILNDAQFGFRPGLSTECAIMSLKQTVRYYTDRNTPVYAAFLDLSKAFDLVRYDILWQKLHSTGVSGEVINIFKYWYDHQTNRVKWLGEFSDEYGLECGVRQGGLTSPSLFNLYMNGLIDGLSNSGVGCSIDGHCINSISYADDMVLLSPSIAALRKLLGMCEEYARAHGLLYNAQKSELLVFKTRGRTLGNVAPVLLNGVALRRVSEFKYLGHIVTEDLNDDSDIERERRAMAVRCNMLARRFARCSIDVKITLFKAFCQGLYTCNLWVSYTQRAINALRVQYNNAFRVLVGLPRYCSASAMFVHAHTDGFYTVLRRRIASLMLRARGSANTILGVLSHKLDSPLLRHWVQTQVHVPGAPVGGKYLN